MTPKRTLAEMVWPRVLRVEGDGCWEWEGCRDPHGYGQLTHERRRLRAHRAAWELVHGPIPDGLHVLHKCDNPPCCRPDHLFLGTDLDNMRDRAAKGRWKGGAPFGERCGSAKFTDKQVREIRARFAAGGVGLRQLAREYGAVHATISCIVKRTTWPHIE